jgi:hypothetical protein
MSPIRATGLNFVRSMPPLCEHVFADVDVFDVREDERATVLASHGVRDIYGFVELLGEYVMNELARALGLKWDYLALHAEGASLDAGGFYLYLNTWSLTQLSREHATVQHTHFFFVRLLIDHSSKSGGASMAVAVAFSMKVR